MIDKEYLRNVSTINFENDSSYDKLLDALSGGKQVGHFQQTQEAKNWLENKVAKLEELK